MKKRLLLFALLLVTVMSLCACGSKETPAEDFRFEMINGEIMITGYVGTEREIHIPKKINDRPVTIIGEEAFSRYDLTYIAVPDTVTQIQEAAFAYCRCLEKVKISRNLEIINQNAFMHCEALTEIELPDTLQNIGVNAFNGCDKLEYLAIPDNVGLAMYTQSSSQSMDGLRIYGTQFVSFLGTSMSMQYSGSYNGHTPEDEPFEQLSTVIIVKEGSYAHQQLQKYEQYGVISYKFK